MSAQPLISTPAMLALRDMLRVLADQLSANRDRIGETPTRTELPIENKATLVVEYVRPLGVVRATADALGISIAAHASSVQRAIVLVERELWHCLPKHGFVLVLDDECPERYWVARADYAMGIENQLDGLAHPPDK